jgi:hypothetical protein
MFHYFTLSIAALCLSINTISAQPLTILPIETDYQPFSMDELFQVTVVNPTNNGMESIFDMRLEDNNGRLILSATSAPILWKKGTTALPTSARATMRFVYEKSLLSSTLRETGRLPFGNYILCYRCLDTKDQSVLGLACRERNIKPMLPPELVNPTNGDIVETLQPLLLWRGPLPSQSQGVSYSLRLVEQPSGKTDALNALQTRPPLVNMNQLSSAFLPFPMAAKPLEDGKFYAWQVEAWQGKLSLGVTDAWSFQVKLPKVAAVAPVQENYCWVKEVEDGNHCSSVDSLKFMYNNIENDTFLNFWIVNKEDKKLNFSVPQIALVKGINAIALSLDDIQVTKPKDLFRLYILDAKGRRSFLSFRRFSK